MRTMPTPTTPLWTVPESGRDELKGVVADAAEDGPDAEEGEPAGSE